MINITILGTDPRKERVYYAHIEGNYVASLPLEIGLPKSHAFYDLPTFDTQTAAESHWRFKNYKSE